MDESQQIISSSEIELEVEKILSSREFAQSQRLSRFLRFTVAQAICHEGDRLKEYSIAMEVFDRSQSFDPRTNPIVRVEAGRLRSKLKEYYKGDGRHDALRIVYPKGNYVPLFHRHPSSKERSLASPPRRKHQAIAVLPFVDLSQDKDQEHFCDGLAEELVSQLMKVEGIRVVSRSSAFAFKGHAPDIREVGRHLNVNTILDGSVRKVGNKLRVTARITTVSDGYQIWSETHDRSAEDTLAVQDQIARFIVNNLRIKLLGDSSRVLANRHTGNREAYNFYLTGRHYWNKRTDEGLKTSIRYFEQAIAHDPEYALAYVGLADSYSMLGNRGAFAPKEAFPKAKMAAEKALEIDQSSAEAHTSLAVVKALYDWEWLEAELEFKKAIALSPAYALASHWYAVNCLAPMGRLNEAITHMKRAQDLDPISLVIGTVLGRLFYFKGLHDEAIEQLRKTIELDPSFYLAHWHLGQAYERKGKYREAIAALESARQLSDGNCRVITSLGYTYAVSGQKALGRKALHELEKLSKSRYVCPTDFAGVHLGLGEKDQALRQLALGYRERAVGMIHLTVDPTYEVLRANAAFIKLSGAVMNSARHKEPAVPRRA